MDTDGEASDHEADSALLRRHGRILFQVAEASIRHGLDHGAALEVAPPDFAPELSAHRATFVTLQREGALRGCVGTARAWRAMIADIADNAHGAAFGDKRFSPLTADERDALDIAISLLSAARPMRFRDEADLLGQLRPGVDGLIVEDGKRRALFLPSVWETLPQPRRFLTRLKVKAGLAANHWSSSLRAASFVATSIDRVQLTD